MRPKYIDKIFLICLINYENRVCCTSVHTVHYSIIMGWQKIVIQYIFNNIIKGTVSQDF